jgi:hypothetical protein
MHSFGNERKHECLRVNLCFPPGCLGRRGKFSVLSDGKICRHNKKFIDNHY